MAFRGPRRNSRAGRAGAFRSLRLGDAGHRRRRLAHRERRKRRRARLLTSAYQFGYRIAFLATDALILISAAYFGWASPTLLRGGDGDRGGRNVLSRPNRRRAMPPSRRACTRRRSIPPGVCSTRCSGRSLRSFDHGWMAVVMLAAITLYQLPYFVRGPMANPVLSRHRPVEGSMSAKCAAPSESRRSFSASPRRAIRSAASAHALAGCGRHHSRDCDGGLRAAGGRKTRHNPVRARHGGRQFQHQFCRRRPRRLSLQPHEPRLYRDAICAAEFGLYLGWEDFEGILGRPHRHA